jgi:hypothetical protein
MEEQIFINELKYRSFSVERSRSVEKELEDEAE